MSRVEELTVDDTKYTIYGHQHDLSTLEAEMTDIDDYMREMDGFALETLGYTPSMEVNRSYHTDNPRTYTGKLLSEAEAYVDHVYGPDAKSWKPIVGGLLVSAVSAGYLGKKCVDQLEEDEETTPTMGRREFLAAGTGIMGAYSTGGFDALLPETSQDTIDKTPAPLSTTYGDMRDVVMAEGLANIDGKDNILAIFGKAHAPSIATYLEQEDLREDKYSHYSNILPSWQLNQTRWTQDDESRWTLDKVEPAHEW